MTTKKVIYKKALLTAGTVMTAIGLALQVCASVPVGFREQCEKQLWVTAQKDYYAHGDALWFVTEYTVLTPVDGGLTTDDWVYLTKWPDHPPLLEYFSPDGMFFDMPFWRAGKLCHCSWCQKRWADEVGGEMPSEPSPLSSEYDAFNTKKFDWMADFVQSVVAHVKSRRPEMPVEFNWAQALAGNTGSGCGEGVNRAIDYCGGDLYGDTISQSIACKLYYGATRNQPYEYMFSRCKPALRTHTMTKSLDEMRTAMAVTAANHGATLVIDAIDPVGTMDRRVYERIGKAFSFVKPYDSYYRGALATDAGVYYGLRSRHDAGNDPKTNQTFTSTKCMSGCARILSEHHIPYGITGNWSHLDYPYLFAPVLKDTESGDADRLIAYVRDGGTLYLSGADNPVLLRELVGGELQGYMAENMIYVAPKKRYETKFHGFNAKYPLSFERISAPIVKGVDRKSVVATITLPYTEVSSTQFASIHSDPPGRTTDLPAVVIRNYGRGKVVWSALPLEAMDVDDYGEILLSLVFGQKRDFTIRTDAPTSVEAVLFHSENELLVNLVAHNTRTHAVDIPSFHVSVKCAYPPREIRLAPDGQPVKFSWRNGYVSFRTRKLHIFDLYQILL